ncbi:uncharacterized protein M6B38_307370 [Iris pallida]|uniref:Uncharacterized protein n=1 Tax=Iris pallida TaxID=29817 RepID=A0AAX6HK41_IRIPA|nr:uncharacterized protein M6B38_307370 [Iris pallida]
MSSVDHKCPLLTTNILCNHKSCTKSSSTYSSFLIMPLGPSCPMALFRSNTKNFHGPLTVESF